MNNLKWTKVQAGKYRAEVLNPEGNVQFIYTAWSTYDWAFGSHWLLELDHIDSEKRIRFTGLNKTYKQAKQTAQRHLDLTVKEAMKKPRP